MLLVANGTCRSLTSASTFRSPPPPESGEPGFCVCRRLRLLDAASLAWMMRESGTQQQQAGELAAQTTTGAACDVLFQQIGESSPWLRPEAEEPGWEKQERGGPHALGQPASLLVAWNTDAC
uniref:uncharacterized protein LOC118530642 isoform X4 n=1 Tax=Halichoerus grypus TaxID=9711 RepID=UPI001659DBAC|nr:uncharacterized protein LOC118530642 isoform X4 [Halichoerus grypus]